MIDLLTAAAIVTGIGTCVVNEISSVQGADAVPGRTCLLMPGSEIAWDACDCKGQFAQVITRWYPTTKFPTEASLDPALGGCEPYARAVSVTASINRCVPGLDQGGRPPTCDSLLQAALQQQRDAVCMERAIACCLSELKRTYQIYDWRQTGSTFIGPTGNCAGITVTYLFQIG